MVSRILFHQQYVYRSTFFQHHFLHLNGSLHPRCGLLQQVGYFGCLEVEQLQLPRVLRVFWLVIFCFKISSLYSDPWDEITVLSPVFLLAISLCRCHFWRTTTWQRSGLFWFGIDTIWAFFNKGRFFLMIQDQRGQHQAAGAFNWIHFHPFSWWDDSERHAEVKGPGVTWVNLTSFGIDGWFMGQWFPLAAFFEVGEVWYRLSLNLYSQCP